MVLKRLIAATASIALMATPAMAAPSASTAAPATEQVDGLQAGGTGNIAVILAALVAVGLGIYFLVKDHSNPPASP